MPLVRTRQSLLGILTVLHNSKLTDSSPPKIKVGLQPDVIVCSVRSRVAKAQTT
jgi:hypothetical protein